ncbi:hypothetical protein BDP55DRAFT_635362 [Colletotrichum godetiae]|uniref:Uncharacterized protein n=1 Tax=Colletotrichum godetiae TaxID=1209918 RepID=A0AAJ0AEU2_9PEZI|nr:uncharacterized protein BDP55DRAFT_635362 [Colletotrichum godetiae]KAK1671939.1 hypothetical protein BDP55DRAFT_635362 [Colletotrichum godetiae]
MNETSTLDSAGLICQEVFYQYVGRNFAQFVRPNSEEHHGLTISSREIKVPKVDAILESAKAALEPRKTPCACTSTRSLELQFLSVSLGSHASCPSIEVLYRKHRHRRVIVSKASQGHGSTPCEATRSRDRLMVKHGYRFPKSYVARHRVPLGNRQRPESSWAG